MKTLLLAVSLMHTQPAIPQLDMQWFDAQAFTDHLKSYLIEDVKSVSKVINASLRERGPIEELSEASPGVVLKLTAQRQEPSETKSRANEVQ